MTPMVDKLSFVNLHYKLCLNKTFMYWQELTCMKWEIGRLQPYLHCFLYSAALCPPHTLTSSHLVACRDLIQSFTSLNIV